MNHAANIILEDELVRQRISTYERSLDEINIGKAFSEIRMFIGDCDEENISKILLLFIHGGGEVRHEISRALTSGDCRTRTNYFIRQLRSSDRDIYLNAILILGILKDPLAIPALSEELDLNDLEGSKAIVSSLGKMDDPLAIKIIKKALSSKNKDLLLIAIKTLSTRTDDVTWHVFKPFLAHHDSEIRIESAFSIASRRSPKCSNLLLNAIKEELNPETRYILIRYAGMIPCGKMLAPLLNIAIYDPDQKARLVASRALDRLQGLIRPSELFKLREHSDPKIKAEAIFRLGKFGTDNDRYKKFIRETLLTSKNQLVIQSCLQAIGYIAEHDDRELLAKFLTRDPLSAYNALQALTRTWRQEDRAGINCLLQTGLSTTYNATMALTRTWRMEDKNKILETIHAGLTSTQLQIVLKFLIRRRGFSIETDKILETAKGILRSETNMNARYLSINLLEFTPSPETLTFLLSLHSATQNAFEKEAVERVLSNIILNCGGCVLSFIDSSNEEECGKILHFIGKTADPEFYRDLSTRLFYKFGDTPDVELHANTLKNVCRIFICCSSIAKQFIQSLPSVVWKRLFAGELLRHAPMHLIEDLKEELVSLLPVNDEEIVAYVMQLLIALKSPEITPQLISVAESGKNDMSSRIARNIIRSYSEEDIL